MTDTYFDTVRRLEESREAIRQLWQECGERGEAIATLQAKYNAVCGQLMVYEQAFSDLETNSNDHAEMVLIVASARRQLQEVS